MSLGSQFVPEFGGILKLWLALQVGITWSNSALWLATWVGRWSYLACCVPTRNIFFEAGCRPIGSPRFFNLHKTFFKARKKNFSYAVSFYWWSASWKTKQTKKWKLPRKVNKENQDVDKFCEFILQQNPYKSYDIIKVTWRHGSSFIWKWKQESQRHTWGRTEFAVFQIF